MHLGATLSTLYPHLLVSLSYPTRVKLAGTKAAYLKTDRRAFEGIGPLFPSPAALPRAIRRQIMAAFFLPFSPAPLAPAQAPSTINSPHYPLLCRPAK